MAFEDHSNRSIPSTFLDNPCGTRSHKFAMVTQQPDARATRRLRHGPRADAGCLVNAGKHRSESPEGQCGGSACARQGKDFDATRPQHSLPRRRLCHIAPDDDSASCAAGSGIGACLMSIKAAEIGRNDINQLYERRETRKIRKID